MMKRSQTLIFIMILFTINSCVQSSKLKENTSATKNKKEIEEKSPATFIAEIDIYELNKTSYYKGILDCQSKSKNLVDSIDTSTQPFPRKVIYRHYKDIPLKKDMDGKHVFNICVDKSGRIGAIKLLESPASLNNIKTLMKSAIRYQFEASDQSPCMECGKITFDIEIGLLRSKT